MSFLVSLGYVFTAIILVLSILRNGVKTWSLNLFASIFILAFYCVIPLLCIVLYDSNTTLIAGYSIPKQNGILSAECLFVIFIGVLTYTLSYSFTSKRADVFRHYQLVGLRLMGANLTLAVAWLLIIFSSLSLVIYIEGFGSFEEAVKMADAVRAGIYSNENQGAGFLFFKRFISLSLIPLLVYPLTKPRNDWAKIPYVAIPCINLLVYYFYLENSRQGIIELILIPVFGFLVAKKKLKLDWLFFLFIAVLIISPLLDTFFTAREFVNAQNRGFLDTALGEMGFPFFSLQASCNYDAPLNWFSDFIDGIFGNFLPSSWGPDIQNSSYYNSVALGMTAGTVPPGLFAAGYYALRIFGVIVIAVLTGWLFAKLDAFFTSHPYHTKYVYAFAILGTLTWVRTGTPGLYLYHTQNVTLLLFIWLLYRSREIQKSM